MRSLRVTAGLIGVSLLVTSCIELGAAPGDVLAPAELRSGIKNLVVYRRPAFFLDNKPVYLTLNGIDIAKIKINEFVEVGVVEGPHTLGARCSASGRLSPLPSTPCFPCRSSQSTTWGSAGWST